MGSAPSLNVAFPRLWRDARSLHHADRQHPDRRADRPLCAGPDRARELARRAGIRQDWVVAETENYLTGGSISNQSSSATTYRAALLYLFENGLAPYASYSTSFEPVIGVDAQGQAFVPTEAEQYEIGLKYQPTFMDALFTVSAFNIRQQNVLTPARCWASTYRPERSAPAAWNWRRGPM